MLGHLGEHGPASSAELRAALPELGGSYDPAPGKRWGGSVPVAPRVLTVLSARGDVVRGPNDGGWTASRPRWTTAADWISQASDPMPVPNMGWFATCKDPHGNEFGLWQNDASAPMPEG